MPQTRTRSTCKDFRWLGWPAGALGAPTGLASWLRQDREAHPRSAQDHILADGDLIDCVQGGDVQLEPVGGVAIRIHKDVHGAAVGRDVDTAGPRSIGNAKRIK